MDGTGKPIVVHCCSCSRCRSQPDGPTAKQHRALNDLVATLDEKSRRLVVALLAKQQGRGGITRFARITGLKGRLGHGRARLLPSREPLETRLGSSLALPPTAISRRPLRRDGDEHA